MRRLLGRHSSIPDLVRSTPLFRHLSRKDAMRLAELADEIHVDAGEVLAREGEPARRCHLVVDGWADVMRMGQRLGALGPGAIAGEAPSRGGAFQQVTVVARTPMTLLMLDVSVVSALLDGVYPPWPERRTIG